MPNQELGPFSNVRWIFFPLKFPRNFSLHFAAPFTQIHQCSCWPSDPCRDAESWCCGCWVTGSDLKLAMAQPATIHLCSEEQDNWVVLHLSHSFSPCKSFFSSTAVHCSFSLSHSYTAFCSFPHASFSAIPLTKMPVQLASLTIITQIKVINSFLLCSFIFCISSTSYRLTLSLF